MVALILLGKGMVSMEFLPKRSFLMSLEKVVDRVDRMIQCFQLCFEVH